jgi:plastocyanin
MSLSTDRSVGSGEVRSDSRVTWRKLTFASGLLATMATGAVSLALGDVEGGAVTFGFALATWLTRVGRGMLGAGGVALVSTITLYFMLTAALTNIGAGSPMSAVVVSSLLTAVALLGLIAAGGYLIWRDRKAGAAPLLAVGASAVLLVGLLISGAGSGSASDAVGGIDLVSENLAFSQTEINGAPGELTVSLENKDLFWHTFTIEELGVDLRVPVGAELAVTFEAAPGAYQFICAIPGHPEAGMVGTLTVEG